MAGQEEASRIRRIFKTARSSTKLAYALTVLAGAVTSLVVSPYLTLIVMPWRRPIQDWMIAHGWGGYASKAAIVNLRLPDILLCVLAGVCIGIVAHRRWLRFALLFSFCYFLIWTLAFLPDSWGFWSLRPNVAIQKMSLDVITTVPFAVVIAWMAARYARRRHARLHAREFCAACGYNLRGNLSGRCPECATRIPQDEAAAATE